MNIHLDACYAPSDDVVAREIEGELIIVPLTSGIGDMEDEIYTLNETGRNIWRRMDGRTTVRGVIEALSSEFEAAAGEIEQDVVGLLRELVTRRMMSEVKA